MNQQWEKATFYDAAEQQIKLLCKKGIRSYENEYTTYPSLYLIAARAAGLVLLFVLGKVFSKTTLQWIETAVGRQA